MHIGIKFHGFHNGPTVECVSMTDFLSAGASIFVSLKVIFTHLLSPLVGAQVCVSLCVCPCVCILTSTYTAGSQSHSQSPRQSLGIDSTSRVAAGRPVSQSAQSPIDMTQQQSCPIHTYIYFYIYVYLYKWLTLPCRPATRSTAGFSFGVCLCTY